MKRYKAKYNPKLNKGVYGISLVENPAMEGLFIALSKDEVVQLKTVDAEKRIVVGLVLEPEKDIYRNQNGEEFTITFDADTVKDLCYAFTQNQNNSNSTIEHDIKQKTQGVTFVENWLVRDEKMDTSLAFGLTPKKDSWMSIAKIDDDNIWNDYVKSGKVQGFSIDAMLSLEEVNLKSNIEMSNTNSLLERILLALTPNKQVEVKLGEIMLADGSLKIEYDGDMLAPEIACWVTAEDGTRVPVPVGEHPLEDGTILIVEQEGIVKEVKPAEVEEEAPAPAQDMATPETEGKVSNDAKIASEIESAIKSILIKYTTQEQTIAELKSQVEELGKQPASKPISSTPMQLDLSKMTKPERILFNLRNN